MVSATRPGAESESTRIPESELKSESEQHHHDSAPHPWYPYYWRLGCVASHETRCSYDFPLRKTILISKMWTKMLNLQNPSGPCDLKIPKMHGEVKKSKSENCIKWGPKICRMTRGFQIWPQNSNRITFDPLLVQLTVESRDFLGIFEKNL